MNRRSQNAAGQIKPRVDVKEVGPVVCQHRPAPVNPVRRIDMSNATATPAPKQRKARPKPPRSVRLVVEPSAEESGVLIITVGKQTFPYFVDEIPSDFGRAFCLSKFTGESYAVNLGDAVNPPSCECLGFQRWGHRGPCKHLAGLTALVHAGRL
jgi:hypothetical protein